MAETNGTSTPPAGLDPPSSTTSTNNSALKRKREDDDIAHAETTPPARSTQIQQDILTLLQQHDTSPSFLKHEISESPITNGPSQKKARLSKSAGKTTISDKLTAGGYSSLGSLAEDAARVSKDVESSLRARTRNGETKDGGRLSVEDLKQIQRVKAFEEFVKEVVDKERQRYGGHKKDGVKQEPNGMVNGDAAGTAGTGGKSGTVLTLFGMAPKPRQLFSSMQNACGAKQEPFIKSELPVEEMSLPNGLTATKVMPAPLSDIKKGPTFEEAFPPPYNLPTLHPPKIHKRSSARDTKLTWEFKDPIARGSKKGGYTVQSLTTGEWLGYGGIGPASDVKEKRKQRERALSSGAETAKEPPSEASLGEQQAREEEAMFRRAYSSFAPSYDNAKAIIPAETKSAIWWDKVGERRFLDVFAIDPALVDEQPALSVNSQAGAEEDVVDDADFKKVIESLDELEAAMGAVEKVTDKTDIDQVLHDISNLLETLASHQRIRNATLATSSTTTRTPISPAPVLAAKIGKPDEPAEDEIATYHALRRELAYLILKLPPYTVAKIDGDQLAELGVSRLITVQGKDVKGIMEEDQVARLAKHNAQMTAAGIASLARSSSATAGQHYSSTSQRTPAIGQAANTRYGSSQYQASRTPAPAAPFQRSVSNQSTYGTPGSTAARSYGTQPNQYSRPAVPQQNSYTQPNSQQYYNQRSTPLQSYYGASYNSQATRATQQANRPTYSTASSSALGQFQQRSHAAAANAVAYQTNSAGGRASPANVQPRPVYPGGGAQQFHQHQAPSSGRATPTGYSGSGPQTPVNGFARPPSAQQQVRQASGTPQP